MPELDFSVDGAFFDRCAATPLIRLRLRVRCSTADASIRNLMLQCQVRIDPLQRRHAAAEQAALVELFGQPDRWSRSLHSLLWAQTTLLVPAFDADCSVELPLPCSFDFNLAASKYCHGLASGEIPLLLLFSGTIFFDNGAGLQIAQIPWTREARYRLPVALWQQLMAHHYPEGTWLRLSQPLFERLRQAQLRSGCIDPEQLLERLLDAAEAARDPLRECAA